MCAEATDKFGDGCPVSQTILKQPWASMSDAAGNLYISDSGNNLIHKVDAKTGIMSVFAGGGTGKCANATDSLGDGCLATEAVLNSPRGIGYDPQGNIVFTDTGSQVIRKIDATTGIVTILAGTGAAPDTSNLPSNSAPKSPRQTPIAAAVDFLFDSTGNLWIPASGMDAIEVVTPVDGKIDPDKSLVYIAAGIPESTTSSPDGGIANESSIHTPRGMLQAPNGDLIFSEFAGNKVRRFQSPVQKDGTLNFAASILTTIAGKGTTGATGDGGLATAATLTGPADIAFDSAGNLYILQNGSGTERVRVVDRKSGIISGYAGTGPAGAAGDGGPANAATINGPFGISFDRLGRLFIDAYSSNTVRMVALNNVLPFTAVGASSASQNVVLQADLSTTLTAASIANSQEFTLGTPSGCSIGGAIAADGYCELPISFTPALPGWRHAALQFQAGTSQMQSLGLSAVGIAPQLAFDAGRIHTIAGTGTAGTASNGNAASATVNVPRGGAVDYAGNLFFADSNNHVVRKIDLNGNISTVVGTGTPGFSGDGSSASTAQLNSPVAVAVDPAGNLYISDSGNQRIRFVDVSTGIISTIAGTGNAGYSGDGDDATAAMINQPGGLALDGDGTVYFADTGNNVVRKFFPHGGIITTVAGNGIAGYEGDGDQASKASLNMPLAVAFDIDGDLFIADAANSVIRKVDGAGLITTVAGHSGIDTNAGDGGPAVSATLSHPSDIAIDAAGDLYVASGNQVRFISHSGAISTILGNGQTGAYAGEGGLATAATIPAPASNLALDGTGKLYLFATAANRVIMLDQAAAPSLTLGFQTPNTTSIAQNVQVINSGNSDLVLNGIALSGEFTLNASSNGACQANSTIKAGESCLLSVAFSPTTLGAKTGTITLTDNALNDNSATQVIQLSGTGAALNVTTTTITAAPTNLVYGSPITLSATVTGGGSSASGEVTFSVDHVAIATAPLVNGAASVTLPSLGAGVRAVSAGYSGDANNSSSEGSTSITIARATLTVTATDASRAAHAVNPSFQYTVTGFVNGDSITAIAGSPELTTTADISSPEGVYPILVGQGTLTSDNYTFKLVNGHLTLTASGPYGYSLSSTAPLLTAKPGESIAEAIRISTVGGYNGTLTFSCQGLPAGYECFFNPSTVAVSGSGVQAVQVTVQNTLQATRNSIQMPKGLALALIFPFGALLTSFGRRRRLGMLTVLLVAAACGVIAGCGDSGGQQSYHITVTAADNASSPLQETTTFDLTIAK